MCSSQPQHVIGNRVGQPGGGLRVAQAQWAPESESQRTLDPCIPNNVPWLFHPLRSCSGIQPCQLLPAPKLPQPQTPSNPSGARDTEGQTRVAMAPKAAPRAAPKAAPKAAPGEEKKEFVHPAAKHARKQ